jgi:hypothetical protein
MAQWAPGRRCQSANNLVMRRSGFSKHTDNDPEKPAEFRRSFILHRGARSCRSAVCDPPKLGTSLDSQDFFWDVSW